MDANDFEARVLPDGDRARVHVGEEAITYTTFPRVSTTKLFLALVTLGLSLIAIGLRTKSRTVSLQRDLIVQKTLQAGRIASIHTSWAVGMTLRFDSDDDVDRFARLIGISPSP